MSKFLLYNYVSVTFPFQMMVMNQITRTWVKESGKALNQVVHLAKIII